MPPGRDPRAVLVESSKPLKGFEDYSIGSMFTANDGTENVYMIPRDRLPEAKKKGGKVYAK